MTKKAMFVGLGTFALLAALPAQAQQGPFPALLNALTGNSGASAPPGGRVVPQPHFVEPRRVPGAMYRVAPQRLPSGTQVYRIGPSGTVRPDTRSVSIYRRQELSNSGAVRVTDGTGAQIDPRYLPTVVPYDGGEAPGTIVIDTNEKHLYLVQKDGTARRYGVGVGRPGFQWAGTHKVTRKAEWPDWRPPADMRERQPGLPVHVKGGPNNPLGARALYLGSTLYRIHGSNEPWTIGRAVSSGCIRMRNEDVIDLYERVGVGTRVIVS